MSRIVLALSFEHGPSLDGAWGGLLLSGMPLAQAAEDLGPLKVLPSKGQYLMGARPKSKKRGPWQQVL